MVRSNRAARAKPAGSTRAPKGVDFNALIASLIGLFVVALFFVVVLFCLGEVNSAPISQSVDRNTGAYDPFGRAVQVVGLVTPVLTTIVGFYFGVRAGSSGRESAESRANDAEKNAQSVASDALENYLDTQKALTTLRERLASEPGASTILDGVEEENPKAFAVDSWLRRVAEMPRNT